MDDERLGLKDKPAAEAVPLVVTGGFGAFAGEAWRLAATEDWTSRASGLLAMVVEGPALPERG